MSELQKFFREKGWQLIFTPPYSPKFQPIELFWRNSKNCVRQEYRKKRNIRGVYDDLADYWFGTDASAVRKRKWPAFGADKASSLVKRAKLEMDIWVKAHGVRCSGAVGEASFSYDDTVDYPNGFVLDEDQATEDAIAAETPVG